MQYDFLVRLPELSSPLLDAAANILSLLGEQGVMIVVLVLISRLMAEAYLRKYEQVLDGEALNPEPPHALVPDRKREWIKRG